LSSNLSSSSLRAKRQVLTRHHFEMLKSDDIAIVKLVSNSDSSFVINIEDPIKGFVGSTKDIEIQKFLDYNPHRFEEYKAGQTFLLFSTYNHVSGNVGEGEVRFESDSIFISQPAFRSRCFIKKYDIPNYKFRPDGILVFDYKNYKRALIDFIEFDENIRSLLLKEKDLKKVRSKSRGYNSQSYEVPNIYNSKLIELGSRSKSHEFLLDEAIDIFLL